jgi:hypothetical protein
VYCYHYPFGWKYFKVNYKDEEFPVVLNNISYELGCKQVIYIKDGKQIDESSQYIREINLLTMHGEICARLLLAHIGSCSGTNIIFDGNTIYVELDKDACNLFNWTDNVNEYLYDHGGFGIPLF